MEEPVCCSRTCNCYHGQALPLISQERSCRIILHTLHIASVVNATSNYVCNIAVALGGGNILIPWALHALYSSPSGSEHTTGNLYAKLYGPGEDGLMRPGGVQKE